MAAIPQTLKVLSYNIHKGFNFRKSQLVLEPMREAIRAISPDFVFLQEVIGHHSRSHHVPDPKLFQAQFEFLADQIWQHYAYGKNAIYADTHHGNAILSKYPIKFWENIDISNNSLEKRGILHEIAEIPEKKIDVHLLCLHLDLLEKGRQAQADKLTKRVSEKIKPDDYVLVCGDFNDWRQSVGKVLTERLFFAEAFLKLHGEYVRSYPALMPFLRLDRIYFRNLIAKNAVSFTGQPWNKFSDHLAVYADFEFPTP